MLSNWNWKGDLVELAVQLPSFRLPVIKLQTGNDKMAAFSDFKE